MTFHGFLAELVGDSGQNTPAGMVYHGVRAWSWRGGFLRALDGGQIVYQLAEVVKGSPLSERAMIFGQQFGLLLLVVLMSFAFYNDLSRIFG